MTNNQQPQHITLIAAISREGAIGIDNTLPWHLPSDLAFFKAQTLGKPIIMGRKTWDSIGRALPGRTNVVISRQPRADLNLPETVKLYASLTEALAYLSDQEEVMVIGGAEIFAQAMPLATGVIVNRIDTTIPNADTYFPDIDSEIWSCVHQDNVDADAKNEFAQIRERWERLNPQ